MKKYLIVSGCSWGDPNFISAEHSVNSIDFSNKQIKKRIEKQTNKTRKIGSHKEVRTFFLRFDRILCWLIETIQIVVFYWFLGLFQSFFYSLII